jgi:hypothetical protein
LPIIVAISSYVTIEIEERTLDIGFDQAFQSPISVEIIRKEINPLVMKRQELINQN